MQFEPNNSIIMPSIPEPDDAKCVSSLLLGLRHSGRYVSTKSVNAKKVSHVDFLDWLIY